MSRRTQPHEGAGGSGKAGCPHVCPTHLTPRRLQSSARLHFQSPAAFGSCTPRSACLPCSSMHPRSAASWAAALLLCLAAGSASARGEKLLVVVQVGPAAGRRWKLSRHPPGAPCRQCHRGGSAPSAPSPIPRRPARLRQWRLQLRLRAGASSCACPGPGPRSRARARPCSSSHPAGAAPGAKHPLGAARRPEPSLHGSDGVCRRRSGVHVRRPSRPVPHAQRNLPG